MRLVGRITTQSLQKRIITLNRDKNYSRRRLKNVPREVHRGITMLNDVVRARECAEWMSYAGVADAMTTGIPETHTDELVGAPTRKDLVARPKHIACDPAPTGNP